MLSGVRLIFSPHLVKLAVFNRESPCTCIWVRFSIYVKTELKGSLRGSE